MNKFYEYEYSPQVFSYQQCNSSIVRKLLDSTERGMKTEFGILQVGQDKRSGLFKTRAGCPIAYSCDRKVMIGCTMGIFSFFLR